MYTIFKNESSIILTDSLEYEGETDFYYFNKVDLNDLLKKFDKKLFKIILYHHDLELLWQKFASYFDIIEAAGGVVMNDKKDILFIFRNDKWDLPKGKIEVDENVEMAAIREVKEECGLKHVVLGSYILKTYHIYSEKGKDILKISHWYFMKSNENELVPQLEEDITKVIWKNSIQVNEAIKNTYKNIVLLIKEVNGNILT